MEIAKMMCHENWMHVHICTMFDFTLLCVYSAFFVVLDWNEEVPQRAVLQAALMMKTGCLKVLKIKSVPPSQCVRLLRELPHCTRLQKFGIQLTDPEVSVS